MQHMPLDDDTMWQEYRLAPFAMAWRMAGNFPPMVSALQEGRKMTRMTQNRYQEVQILWGLIAALIGSGQLRQGHACLPGLQGLFPCLGGPFPLPAHSRVFPLQISVSLDFMM